jgi:hypothetical protein
MKRTLLSAWALIAVAAPAAAQCSMCRTALSHKAGDTFNRAIIILLVPAVAMFGTIFLAVVRYAGSPRQEDPDEKPEE